MSYPPGRKTRTRRRILEGANRLFKLHGYNGVGIDAIMAEAGLTRGGFYAHFESKEKLLAEVILAFPALASTELRRQMDGEGDGTADWALRFVESYLNPDHCDRVDSGCLVPPLSAEASRSGEAVRAAYTRNFREIAAALGRHLEGPDHTPDERAIAAFALCAGGVTLARAVDDAGLSGEILQACRRAAKRQLGGIETAMSSEKTALILIDHGSRRDEANRLLEKVAERVAESGAYPIVEIAHMEIAEPTLATAFARCAERGAERIAIVPYFLASGNHATHDIPRLADEAAAQHPGIEWTLGEPLGLDDRLVDVVLDRASKALEAGSTVP